MSEQADRVRKSISELVTNAYRLGMAQGSGAEVFFSGEIFSYDELAEAQVEKSNHLDAVLEAERERHRQMEEALRFYAHLPNHTDIEWGATAIQKDGGARARLALEAGDSTRSEQGER